MMMTKKVVMVIIHNNDDDNDDEYKLHLNFGNSISHFIPEIPKQNKVANYRIFRSDSAPY